MSREHIRSAQWNLEKAATVFYRSADRSVLREHLIKAIRHITKVLLVTR